MPRRLGPLLAALVSVVALPSGWGAATAGAGGALPDDPAFADGLQWGLEQIDAPGAWRRSTGAGVTIAVVDSGVDLEHEELRAQLVGDVSCIGADGDAAACRGSGQDDSGHGTHVAGIAAAEAGNERGIVGVAPDAHLLAVRVLTAAGCADRDGCSPTGTSADVAAGIRWAIGHGADVINLSLGGAMADEAGCVVCDAIEEAWAQGAVTVLAVGNDAVLPDGFSDEHAVVVTATARTGALASYAPTGTDPLEGARWVVAAPGGETETATSGCATGSDPEGILSTYWLPGGSDGYACQAGTSMAAPHVSGALAVLLAQGRSPQAAVDRLLATAQPLGPVGRIDLGRAVGEEPAAASIAPTDPSTPPASGLAEPLQPAPFTPDEGADEGGDDGLPRWPLFVVAVGLIVAGAVARRRVRFDDEDDHPS